MDISFFELEEDFSSFLNVFSLPELKQIWDENLDIKKNKLLLLAELKKKQNVIKQIIKEPKIIQRIDKTDKTELFLL